MQKRNLPYRKSIRLKGWDYSNPGLYYVTICTKDRKNFLGQIRDGIMGLSVPGCLSNYYWTKIIEQFESIILDEYIVMPNHLHGIIAITSSDAIYGVKNHEEDRDTDAMNRVPTNQVGSSIHRDPPSDKKTNEMEGGATGQHNPMLYKDHLGRIIRWFKGRCTYEIRERDYQEFGWQSRFYDHIIRNRKSLNRIREYIYNNPLAWDLDQANPNKIHEKGVEYMITEN